MCHQRHVLRFMQRVFKIQRPPQVMPFQLVVSLGRSGTRLQFEFLPVAFGYRVATVFLVNLGIYGEHPVEELHFSESRHYHALAFERFQLVRLVKFLQTLHSQIPVSHFGMGIREESQHLGAVELQHHGEGLLVFLPWQRLVLYPFRVGYTLVEQGDYLFTQVHHIRRSVEDMQCHRLELGCYQITVHAVPRIVFHQIVERLVYHLQSFFRIAEQHHTIFHGSLHLEFLVLASQFLCKRLCGRGILQHSRIVFRSRCRVCHERIDAVCQRLVALGV